jgi:general secretion pathway protein F
MAAMLERVADYHDEETIRWMDWTARLFEPLLMALLGLLIGGIVILLYMPIFDLAGSVKQ